MPLKSLRTKLIALVAFILISGFLTTNILSFQVSKDALRTTILQNELPLTSDNIYSEIQADLLRPVFISSLMANDTFLRDWVLEGEQDPERIQRFLSQIKDRYGAFTSYFISNNTLNYYHFSGVARVIDLDNPEDGWFARVRDLNEPYEINVDDNEEQEHALTIFINYRVVDYDGNFIGVTGVGLGLDSVSRLVREYGQSYRRNIFFVDENGAVRLHSELDKTGHSIRDMAGLSAIADKILTEQRGSFAYDRDGEALLLTTRYLPELKWYLFVELPEDEATRGIRRSFIENLVIGFLVIGITLALIVIAINKAQRQLEEMAVTDKLTGLGNRQAFDIGLHQALSRNKRTGEPLSLMMMDLDHFKDINDTFGHVVGDEVIRKFAEFVRPMLREMDVMCRWGGEEFAVLMPVCDAADAVRAAEKIRAQVEATSFVSADPDHKLHLSIGVTAAVPIDQEGDLIARVDSALYAAKDTGRNRVERA